MVAASQLHDDYYIAKSHPERQICLYTYENLEMTKITGEKINIKHLIYGLYLIPT
jgi:hypothetical protein